MFDSPVSAGQPCAQPRAIELTSRDEAALLPLPRQITQCGRHRYKSRGRHGPDSPGREVETQVCWLHGQRERSRARWRPLHQHQQLFFARYLIFIGWIYISLTATERSASPVRPFSNVPFPHDPDYIDRATISDEIHRKLVPGARLALVGLGGVG